MFTQLQADVIPGLTFGDLELVVLLVPQAASLVVDDPDRKLGVRTVGRFQGEIRRCSAKIKKRNHESDKQPTVLMLLNLIQLLVLLCMLTEGYSLPSCS